MNNYIFSILFILFSMVAFGFADSHASELRIATYNIWNPVFEEKYSGQSTWSQRLPFIIENMIASNSDVICLEEVSKKAYLDLINNSDINTRYKSYYLSHGPSQPGQQEGRDGLALFYKSSKATLMQLVQSGDGSRPTHRRDFYADFKLNEQSKKPVRFRVACTHLDSGKDLSIGNKQLLALVEDVLKVKSEDGIDFVVVCGDFNESEGESLRPRYEIMRHAGFVTDGSALATRPESLDIRHKGHVDWIYFKQISNLQLDLIAVPPLGNEKASDHKLTMTDVVIK